MKKFGTGIRGRQSALPAPRHLPLVDILVDAQAGAPRDGRRVGPEGPRGDVGRGSRGRVRSAVCASARAAGVSGGPCAQRSRAGGP